MLAEPGTVSWRGPFFDGMLLRCERVLLTNQQQATQGKQMLECKCLRSGDGDGDGGGGGVVC